MINCAFFKSFRKNYEILTKILRSFLRNTIEAMEAFVKQYAIITKRN